MNAIQPPRPKPQTYESRTAARKPRRQVRYRSYQALALETSAKLAVNLVISSAAVSALVQLLPYHWSQQEKLREINAEVSVIETRVNRLQAELNRNFSPPEAKDLMREQSLRIAPNQRRVILTDKDKDGIEMEEAGPSY
jgi:hypothetical protein